MQKLIFMIVVVFFLYGCKTSKEYNEIQKKFVKNYTEASATSITGNPGKEYIDFYSRFSKLSAREQKRMALKGTSATKFYATFYHFYNPKQKKNLVKIFENNFNDTTSVVYYRGCSQRKTHINTELYEILLYHIRFKQKGTSFKYKVKRLKKNLEVFSKDNNFPQKIKNYTHYEFYKYKGIEQWQLSQLEALKKEFKHISLNHKNTSKRLLKLIEKGLNSD